MGWDWGKAATEDLKRLRADNERLRKAGADIAEAFRDLTPEQRMHLPFYLAEALARWAEAHGTGETRGCS